MPPDAHEASEIARHYGNIRFAMFTVFTAIVGGMVMIPLDHDRLKLVSTGDIRWLLAVAGIAMSVGFAVAEFRVAYLVSFYQKKAAAFHIGTDSGKLGHQMLWGGVVVLIMILPYLCSIAFWITFLCGRLTQTHIVTEP